MSDMTNDPQPGVPARAALTHRVGLSDVDAHRGWTAFESLDGKLWGLHGFAGPAIAGPLQAGVSEVREHYGRSMGALEEAVGEVDRVRTEYSAAVELIARMHAAAVEGPVGTPPVLGVLEDVAALASTRQLLAQTLAEDSDRLTMANARIAGLESAIAVLTTAVDSRIRSGQDRTGKLRAARAGADEAYGWAHAEYLAAAQADAAEAAQGPKVAGLPTLGEGTL